MIVVQAQVSPNEEEKAVEIVRKTLESIAAKIPHLGST